MPVKLMNFGNRNDFEGVAVSVGVADEASYLF